MRTSTRKESEAMHEIARIFLRPLLANTDYENAKEYLEELFGVDTRSIKRFKIKSPFEMVGQLYRRAEYPDKGYIRTKASKGHILVRRDERLPHIIEVEFLDRRSDETRFRIGKKEWKRIQKFLVNAPFKKRKKRNVS